jgi:hypothetical protein
MGHPFGPMLRILMRYPASLRKEYIEVLSRCKNKIKGSIDWPIAA